MQPLIISYLYLIVCGLSTLTLSLRFGRSGWLVAQFLTVFWLGLSLATLEMLGGQPDLEGGLLQIVFWVLFTNLVLLPIGLTAVIYRARRQRKNTGGPNG